MQKISKKSKDKLYSTIDREIMDVRIKIRQKMEGYDALREDIDNILFQLNISTPKKSIEYFKYDKL